jgi:acylphosphatase
VPPARITPIRKQTERERNKMKIETAIWNGKKTKVLAVPSFSSSQEALDFLAEIQKLDKDATLTVTSVSQYN